VLLAPKSNQLMLMLVLAPRTFAGRQTGPFHVGGGLIIQVHGNASATKHFFRRMRQKEKVSWPAIKKPCHAAGFADNQLTDSAKDYASRREDDL